MSSSSDSLMSSSASTSTLEPSAAPQLKTLTAQLSMLNDVTVKDEAKLKAAQELSDNFDLVLASPHCYPQFLDLAMKVFLKILSDGRPHFIAEYNVQQVRKLVLEMIQRLPTNDFLKPYAKQILSLAFKLLEFENEENVLVCLRIIIELHKQFRPSHSVEITQFLHFVKSIYKELPNHLNKIFDPRPPIRVKDLNDRDFNLEAVLGETFTMTPIATEKKGAENQQPVTYNLIPKAVLSLRVLQELPIIVVLMYQLYKQFVHKEVAEFIPLIMSTITLQPTAAQRAHKDFNKEVFVDFMGAQIKTLSFLAYIIRIYQEVVSTHSTQMVKGMLSLLSVCPHEVAHLRKELLIAARHILATELRIKFVPHMENLFNENILLGKGWTTHESLRPLAYSTLADLVHHVRQHLPHADLARAVQLFSRNAHDESLPTSIQTMSCKLLLNLVECIRMRSEQEARVNARDLLMRMMEVFVLKFKTVSKLQLPVLVAKYRAQQQALQQQLAGQLATQQSLVVATGAAQQSSSGPPTPATPDIKMNPVAQLMGATPLAIKEMIEVKTEDGKQPEKQPGQQPPSPPEDEAKKSKFGFPASQANNYSVSDCRALVKTLVCGVKTITWGCTTVKSDNPQHKQFHPKETLVYIRLVKWAMEALDIYTLNTTPGGQALLPGGGVTAAVGGSGIGGLQPHQARTPAMQQAVRTKEEKEVLEHFAGVFALLNPQTFKEVFSETIDYVVERIYKNYALQIMANSFLANNVTSPIFATILVEYLLERMHEMGSNMERSNLYLKLFKLVFGSVSLFAAENEQMLKPHLHSIVNKSMELAKSAKEPYNYFLLLRALFRSIGGGSHDLLYQEFLPLLPNLLQGLNSLQSGLHKQHMKDLFVELCLTVPVRLSSLLPYLPMLMDPLVSALNGSQTLVSQGLRTLELCVDNLQPDFLYEHIQPVRAELMQALWRTLRNPSDQIAHVAFR
jgi:transformation/transcription domain-associated protein